MKDRKLLITSIIIVIFLLLVGTAIKPFNIVITMAQQYVGNYTKGDSGAEGKEMDQKTEKENKNTVPPVIIDNQLTFENTTFIDQSGRHFVTNMDSLMILVNKKRNLPEDYVPENMVIPQVKFSFEGDRPKKYLRKEAALALEDLFQEAKKDNLDLLAVSGYRSYQTQKNIFESKTRSIGEAAANMTSAYPGQSEHQTGLAMDITCAQAGFSLIEDFGAMEEGIWVKKNAHKYGFIVRYPKGKEDITGYSYEPWHLRYVGKETAAYIYEKGITLEEYFAQVYGYRISSIFL